MLFEKSEFQPRTMPKEEFFANAETLTEDELKKLALDKKEKPRSPEEAGLLLETSFRNPETEQEQRIEIDLEKILDEQKAFYRNRLNLEIDEREVKSIWNKNYAEIKSEIEQYGYDSILIVPDDLPEEEILNHNLIETIEETVKGKKKKVAKTYQGDNFQTGGSFAGVKNSYSPKYRIVLVHSDQNIYNNPSANPYLKATLSKNIMGISGLDKTEIARRISNNLEIVVDFEADINGKKTQIQAEGYSLEEYILQQSMYFEKTGKHLDEKSWTWLMKSRSGSLVVDSRWSPGVRQLLVSARDPGDANGALGFRLSRSFS